MSSIRKFISINPFTKEIQREAKFISDSELQHKISLSNESFQRFKTTTFKERSDKLFCLACKIEHKQDYFAELLSQEVGKPILQSRGEVLKSIGHCRFYGKNLERFLKQDRIKTEAKNSGIYYHPLGPIYLMIPFNFPFWLTFKSAVPMIAAGNTVLLRNADSTPILAEELEKVFVEAGFNDNQFQNIYTRTDQLEDILKSKYIQGTSFTGSTNAGKVIAETAGRYLKKAVLELGGSDPFIVCMDADIELAVDMAIKSRLFNNGQVCISAKRFLINKHVYDKFVERLLEKLQEQKQGNPLDESTTIGPFARYDLKENAQRQVKEAIKQGAELLYEQDVSDLPENFYGPVVLQIEDTNNLLFQEETFGPIFSLFKVDSDEQAIEIANDSEFGLGGAVFSKNDKNAEKIAKQLDCGSVFVNDMVKTDSRLPSGGCKQSGYGRECGEVGIKEFINIKAYSIN